MNAKELLKEYPDTKQYWLCVDGEAFVEEAHAQAHSEHFRRRVELIDAKTGNIIVADEEATDEEAETTKTKTKVAQLVEATVNANKEKLAKKMKE